MEHPSDNLWIEYVADRLDQTQRESLREHLAACDVCRGHVEGLEQTWSVLGDWAVGMEDSQRAGRVLEAIENQADRPVILARFGSPWLRVAAAVLLTSTVGYGIGWWARPTIQHSHANQPLADSIVIPMLSETSPIGLTESLLEMNPPTTQEAPG